MAAAARIRNGPWQPAWPSAKPGSRWWRPVPAITDHAGADKAYDVAGFVADLRQYNVTPHVAQNTTNRRSAIDARTTRHPGYVVSGRMRKRIEDVFGWSKAAAGFRKTRHCGLAAGGCSP